jgi:hypothetical protein
MVGSWRVRLMPSISEALTILPSTRASALIDGLVLGLVAHLAQVDRLFRLPARQAQVVGDDQRLPSAMMTARLMQFSISRTLPGHW